MQVNIEKLVDAAVELRIAILRAKEQNIINYIKDEEDFQISSVEDFKNILKTREYKIESFNYPPYKFQYKVVVSGLNFIHISTDYLFKDDKDKFEREGIRCLED